MSVARVLVCGGRTYADREHVYAELDLALQVMREGGNDMLVINGGAPGADSIARDWANARHIHCATIPALWEHHGNAAGPLRNSMMLELRPHLVLAFPGGPGTADMVAKAKAAGIRGKICGARRGSATIVRP